MSNKDWVLCVLKSMFDMGVFTEEEYLRTRAEIITRKI